MTSTYSRWVQNLLKTEFYGDHGLPQALEFTMITLVVPPRL